MNDPRLNNGKGIPNGTSKRMPGVSPSSEVTMKKEAKDMFRNKQTIEQLTKRLLYASDESMKDPSIKECLVALEAAVRSEYPDCKAYLFGSRMCGLGNFQSDLDVFVDVGNVYEGLVSQKYKEQQEILLRVESILLEHPEEFQNISTRPTARVPIIKFVSAKSEIDCDLSFSHGLSVEKSKFVRFCCDLQAIVRPSLLVLKHWVDIHRLKDDAIKSSYPFYMMFIFYLQINGYLLSVEELRDLTKKNAPRINNWKIIEYNKPVDELMWHVKLYRGCVYDSVMGFFEMYKDFAFHPQVICPLLGRTIPTSKFDNVGRRLPEEMSDYVYRIRSDPDCKLNTSSSMCIQDPFDLGHNMTNKVSYNFMVKFKKLCTLSYNYMERN